jgi:hypothetical protein
VKLPDASRFAREIGRLTVSAQLWTTRLVFDLTFSACTDATCRPGGVPERRGYRMEFAVFSRKTRALICSTSGSGASRCRYTGRNWSRQRCRPGSMAELVLLVHAPIVSGSLDAAGCGATFPYYQVPTRANFWQARLGVEFSDTPWARAPVRRPGRPVALVSFDRPTPPPYAAEIVTLNGSTSGIAGWWADHQIALTRTGTSGYAEAKPGKLWDDGYGFTVYLRPRPAARG